MATRRGTRAVQLRRAALVGVFGAWLGGCAIDGRTTTAESDDAMGLERGVAGSSADDGSSGGAANVVASPAAPPVAEPPAGPLPAGLEPAGSAGTSGVPVAASNGAAGSGGAAGAGAEPAAGASGAAGVGVCNEQLLVNGDFDAGEVGWVDTWDVRPVIFERTDPLLAATGVTPQGNYLAWLGGVPNGEYGQKRITTLTQMVSIPENAVSLVMSGQVWVQQTEPGLPTVDWVVMELLNPSSTLDYDGWQIAVWSEENASTGWVTFEFVSTFAAEVYRGLTLPLVLDSRPDGAGTLSVWVDSLRLEARCTE